MKTFVLLVTLASGSKSLSSFYIRDLTLRQCRSAEVHVQQQFERQYIASNCFEKGYYKKKKLR